MSPSGNRKTVPGPFGERGCYRCYRCERVEAVPTSRRFGGTRRFFPPSSWDVPPLERQIVLVQRPSGRRRLRFRQSRRRPRILRLPEPVVRRAAALAARAAARISAVDGFFWPAAGAAPGLGAAAGFEAAWAVAPSPDFLASPRARAISIADIFLSPAAGAASFSFAAGAAFFSGGSLPFSTLGRGWSMTRRQSRRDIVPADVVVGVELDQGLSGHVDRLDTARLTLESDNSGRLSSTTTSLSV